MSERSESTPHSLRILHTFLAISFSIFIAIWSLGTCHIPYDISIFWSHMHFLAPVSDGKFGTAFKSTPPQKKKSFTASSLLKLLKSFEFCFKQLVGGKQNNQACMPACSRRVLAVFSFNVNQTSSFPIIRRTRPCFVNKHTTLLRKTFARSCDGQFESIISYSYSQITSVTFENTES